MCVNTRTIHMSAQHNSMICMMNQLPLTLALLTNDSCMNYLCKYYSRPIMSMLMYESVLIMLDITWSKLSEIMCYIIYT